MKLVTFDFLKTQDEPDKNESSSAIDIVQLIIIISAGMLSVILYINIYHYLLKNGRYKDPSILLFYLNSTIIIVAVAFEASNKTYGWHICPVSVIIDNYLSHSLNLNLGICQACMLTTLCLNLNQLLVFKETME